MVNQYKKITKEDIDFPKCCKFFISNLDEEIKATNLDKNDLEVLIYSSYPYCYDVFSLVTKTYKKKNILVKTPTYKTSEENGKKTYIYKFEISKIDNSDDLPF